MNKNYPYILIIGSIVGLLASFFLMLDTITLIQNREAEIPCNLSPFISCGNAILSEQGQIFGFPNPILGIVFFPMLLLVGIMLTGGYQLNKTFSKVLNLGTLASMIFVLWFFYQSLYNLGSLCIYCMLVWLISWPIFLYTTVYNIRNFQFSIFNKFTISQFINKNHIQILVSVYVLAVLLILFKFRDFFLL